MERNLKQELEELNIVSVECCGVGTEKDIFSCIDAIKEHMAAFPDSEKIAHMKDAMERREARRKAASLK
ncbi:MAG: hypothetical protein KBT02_09025 [Treponema sp.]|nr:hypothetical protein [Candidatus Treponema caballi]